MLPKHPFIIPYKTIVRLSEVDTRGLLNRDVTIFTSNINKRDSKIERCRRNNDMIGGIYVTTREVFESVGGFDERFKGWGCEDSAFVGTIEYLYGKFTRLDCKIWHLYHTSNHRTEEDYKNNLNLIVEE